VRGKMPQVSEGTVALTGLAIFAIWLFAVLPILYLPAGVNDKHKPHSDQATQAASDEPKGAATAPFFVQVIPSPKPTEERIQEEDDREEKKSADRWLVRWTFALFGATIGLILATLILRYFAYRQAIDMRRSIDLAYRPRLIVRRISIDEPRPRGGISAPPCIQVQYVIANIGANTGYVMDNYASLYFVKSGEELPALPPFEGEKNTIGALKFGNGDSKPLNFNSPEKGWRFLQDRLSRGEKMYFLGYVQYRDGIGNIRRTAFCRRYNGNTKRFFYN
jgi:hypothetical protein